MLSMKIPRALFCGCVLLATSAAWGRYYAGIAHCHYSTSRVYNYGTSSVQMLTDPAQVLDFVSTHASLLNNPPGPNRAPDLKWLNYKATTVLYDWEPLYAVVNVPTDAVSEDAFLHATNQPATPSYRLHYWENGAYFMNPASQAWQQAFTQYLIGQAQTRGANGVFLDVVGEWLWCGDQYYYTVVDEPAQLNASTTIVCASDVSKNAANGIAYVTVRTGPGGSGTALPISALQTSTNTVVLASPYTGTVYVSYRATGKPDAILTLDSGNTLEWRNRFEQFLNYVRPACAGVGIGPVIFNGVYPYAPPSLRLITDDYVPLTGGPMSEGFLSLVCGHLPITTGYDVTAWKACVDDLQRWTGAASYAYWAYAGNLSDQYRYDPQSNPTYAGTAQYRRDALFSYTSFLLGAGSTAYFEYGSPDRFDWFYWYDWDLGTPTGPYRAVANGGATYYSRAFQHGLVLCNPTSGSQTIRLANSYLNMAGTNVRSVTLSAVSGTILRR